MRKKILLFYSLIINCFFNPIYCDTKQPIFKCIYNDYDEKHPLSYVVIKNNETEKIKRKTDSDSSDFKDFNIYLDLENIKNDIKNNGLEKNMNFFISSMEKAVNTLQTLLKVKPLETESGYYIRDKDLQSLKITKWDKTKFGDEAINTHNSFQKQNIDLAIFGMLAELPNSTLATASPNAFQKSNHQPFIGTVKINKYIDLSKPNSKVYFETILVHEFTHILGFTKTFFEEIYKNIFYETDKYGIERSYLNSPKLLNVAKKYFNCDSLKGVELENQGGEGTAGSHWETRILLGEYMNGYSYTEEQVISEFTLALLEDSGYYKANYYTGGLMRFGKNKGCAFLEEKCFDKNTQTINPNFENEFFDDISGGKTIEASCSSGRQSRAYKAWYKASNVPEEYQYFDDPDIAGYEPADYCPVYLKHPDEEDLSYYVGHCSNIGSLEYGSKLYYLGFRKYSSKETIKYTGELLSPHSFCYLSSLSLDEDTSKVVRAICYETFCSNKSLTIKIFDDYIVCPRAGGKIVMEGYLGYLLCPDYNLICTGTVTCNSLFDCIDKKS